MEPARSGGQRRNGVSGREWGIATLVAVGAALAILAPFSPWYATAATLHDYTVNNVTFQLTITDTFYPGSHWRYYCTSSANAPAWNQFCPRTWSQPNGLTQSYDCLATPCGANDVGSLYSLVWELTWPVLAMGVALLGGLIFVLNGRGGWRLRTGLGLALGCAAVVGLGLVVGVSLLEPSALAHSASGFGGADSSFWGSCGPSTTCAGSQPGPNGTAATASTEWGPSTGWFLELGAGVLYLTAALPTLRTGLRLRRETKAGPSAQER